MILDIVELLENENAPLHIKQNLVSALEFCLKKLSIEDYQKIILALLQLI